MKKSIIAILAVFLVAALFIGAGSAVTIFPNTNLKDYDDSTVSSLNAGDTLYLITAPNSVITIKGNAAGTITYFTDAGLVAGTYTKSIGNTTQNYVVSFPDVNLNVYLNGSTTDMNGKTVSTQSGLDFVGTPIVDRYTLMHFKFITPAGGETTYFGDVDSSNHTTNWDGTEKFYVNTLLNNGVTSGKWTAKAIVSGAFTDGTTTAISTKTGKNTVSFDVGTTSDSITSDKDKVIRGNSFIITLTGVPNTMVYVTYDGIMVHPGQGTNPITGGFSVKLGSSGVKKIQMDTNSNTEEKSYKIVAKFAFSGEEKSVKVAVEKGTISIAADAAAYYIGNEVTVSGTNTETDKVYLYVKGSNKDLQVIPSDTGRLTSPVIVNSDKTWEKKFTFANEFDAGTYTIYAVGKAYDYNTTTYKVGSLTDAEKLYPYATTAVTLKQPFLSATAAASTIAKGDSIKVTGQVEGTPSALNYFIFGTNYFNYASVTPEDDGTYEIEVKTGDLDLSTGQYFIVVQHPMYDGFFNVVAGYNTSTYTTEAANKYVVSSWATDSKGKIEKPARYIISAINTRQTANAAQAVCDLIDEQYVDDIYVKLDFVVANAYVTINSVGDQKEGATFKVSGTTNVKVDETVVIDVVSTKFQAEPKESISAASYLVQTTKVAAGSNGINTYEATFDGTPLAVDSYTAVATITRATSEDLTVSTTFNIVKGAATPVPTTTGTTAPVTQAPTTAPTATPTPASPGFGALIALAGLGAVAVLVLRRQ